MALVLGDNVGFVTTAPTADPAGTNATIDGNSVVTKDTSPAGAVKITEIGWYRGAGTNTANFEVALYADSAGVAGSRLFVDNTNSSSAGGWIRVAVDWPISPSTAYWLAVQMDAHTGTSSIDSASSGGSGSDLKGETTLNDPYGGGAVSDADGMYAIYALVVTNQTLSAVGNIGTAEVFGTTTVSQSSVVALSAIPSQEAFGVSQVNQSLLLESINSLEDFGISVVQRGSVILALPGVVSQETFGSPLITQAYLVTLSSIPSAESIGSLSINRTLPLIGIPSIEAFGIPSLSIVSTVIPVGIFTSEAFGLPTIQGGEAVVFFFPVRWRRTRFNLNQKRIII